ncbi:hypothetical protein C8N47_1114 [Mangrovibacterium marinum]|uniref:Addiction module component n=1 Tax=Mangrovibacterium marinum TaxID=1639118 RepID=A0A2T5C060_9BACT|nr:hypothetical protein [Mangrovibacterium marinum]PTN07964.1 hypothetical protein C8N47_1114 [Mangrovibacterium marinum]
MDIQALKLDLVAKILSTEKTSVLLQIEKLFDKEHEQDWWDKLPNEVQQAIMEGVEDVSNGNTYSHEEVVREAQRKYGF